MPHSTLKDFDALFPELVNVLTSQNGEHPEPIESLQWFRKALEYNVPFGKKNRGMSAVTAYEHLVKKSTAENLKIARVVGWCVELFQAYFLVTDDIMDRSETRRGLPCWYKKEGVGMIAINDGLLLEQAIYRLLKIYIRDKPYYRDMVELFLESGFQTCVGQCLDTITAPPEGKVDFTDFTVDKHSAIVKWKAAFYSFYLPIAAAMYMISYCDATRDPIEGNGDFTDFTVDKHSAIVKWKAAFYSFYLPIAAAMYMAGISDTHSHTNAKTIMLKMGHYFQTQDDYLDCYGEPEVIGKIGTDIQDNKCSWLIVHALEMASKEHKETLKANYGRWDDACVAKVKSVYRELDIQGLYKRFEDTSYQELVALISQLAGNLPQEIFLDYANRLYKRDK